ncbi:TPA: hypothetical protein DDW35_12320 [Candidatus Sumerlaeota bacterium]|jgi:hypothetical protein|nr:hypothetical protein [Candidatus Sumerlaeota bacterium]
MRTLSSLAKSEAARQGQDAVWVLSIYWADGVRHYTHRAITVGDATLSYSLLTPGKLTQTPPEPSAIPAVKMAASKLEISLALDDATTASVRTLLDAQSPEGLEVEWGLLLLDDSGAAQLSDRIPFFWGMIDKATVSRFALELECVDALTARGIRRFGNELTGWEIPELHGSAEGKMLPVIFGAPGQVALLPWRMGGLFYLSKAIGKTDTIIYVTSTNDLPDAGTVQIGEELITYTALDRTNKTLGTSSAPLSRSEAVAHLVTAVGRWRPTNGFEWAVAQHTCQAVRNVSVSGDLLSTSLWSVTTEVWNEKTVTKVVMSRWPGEADVSHVISAEVEGMTKDSVLLQNPADILRYFLTASDAMDLDTTRLDSDSFTEAATALTALGYVFSNVIGTPKKLQTILERLLLEARCQLVCSGGRIALHFESTNGSLDNPDFTFNQDNILRGDSVALERTANTKLLSGIHLRYGCDFSESTVYSGTRKSTYSNAVVSDETDADAETHASLRLYWHNHGNHSVPLDLGDFLIARYGFRSEFITLHAPFSAAALEAQDQVRIQEALFPLALDAGQVQSVSVPEPHLLQYNIRFFLAGPTCWAYDAQTFLRHRNSGTLLEIWIAGTRVSTVTWNGAWRLSGSVRENSAFTYTVTAPITYDSSSKTLYFSSGVSGNYTPRFALNASGNLLIAGALQEDTSRSDLMLSSCIEATATYFAKGLVETTPVFVFDVNSRCLQVRGRITESLSF